MTDTNRTPSSTVVVPQDWQALIQGEIDLRELLQILWRKKFIIFIITFVFTASGVTYALLAPQTWSSHAVIVGPKNEDMLPLRQVSAQASALGLHGFPDDKALFSQFVLYFNAYDNRRDYLRQTSQFKAAVQTLQLDARAQRTWLREWGARIGAAPLDKKAEKPGTELTFSASSAEGSLEMLKGYIDYITAVQREELIENLERDRTLALQSLEQRYALLLEDTKRNIELDIAKTALANNLATAAGVTFPLVNYNQNEPFPMTLGTKALQEKLSILKSIDVSVYQPKLADMKSEISRLRQVSLEKLAFRPFSYLDAPDEPLARDKPNRPLVVILASLFGGMLAIGVVLACHAFGRCKKA